MRARGMGDPSFIAGHAPIVTRFDGAGAQGSKIGSCIWLGEHRSWQFFPTGQCGQPFLFLRVCTAGDNQFRGNFAARSERADTDIATRQFFADHAHRGF